MHSIKRYVIRHNMKLTARSFANLFDSLSSAALSLSYLLLLLFNSKQNLEDELDQLEADIRLLETSSTVIVKT